MALTSRQFIGVKNRWTPAVDYDELDREDAIYLLSLARGHILGLLPHIRIENNFRLYRPSKDPLRWK